MKTHILSFLFSLFFLFNYAQSPKNSGSLNEGTIDQQFEYLLKKSSNYQQYKVIEKNLIYKLKKHINDSLSKREKSILNLKNQILKQKNEYARLEEELAQTNSNLKEVTESKETIKLFGIPFKRATYKAIIGSIIAILFFALLYFIYMFRNANAVTKKTLSDYAELEEEFNKSRTRALEREQVLNRKLQDEINKQKKA